MGLWIPLVLVFGVVLVLALGALRSGRIGGRRYSSEDRAEPERPGAEPDFSGYPCGHEMPTGPFIVEVFGVKIAIDKAPVCPDCIEDFLGRHSTRCASCLGPILPGMPVGQAWVGAGFPHTHLTAECTESGGLYCGRWGQGRLVTLHELEPGTYAPGTPNVMAHVMKTGRPTLTRIK